ncbi:DUF6678 family protein [Burkholderia sp. Cy-637]|uniref:DUF6678 family protein n=1 Tax=Burkholderia sp. Cy-637 TaxID=2608327 RepID=UPI001963518E|nr:DUF6678 family protein [Burkholderia sp. Cy-637]
MNPMMNDTKWEELRAAMHALSDAPQWRNKIVGTGYVSPWDGEWFHHFRNGGYADLEWVEIKVNSLSQEQAVLAALKAIHLPGHRTDVGFKIYGHLKPGQFIDYV